MIRKSILIVVLYLFAFITFGKDDKLIATQQINIFCNEDNDLYQLLVSSGQNCRRFEDIENALSQCKKNDVLLVLANGYPEQKTPIPESFYETVRDKNLKIYIEFPDRLTSGNTGEIKSTLKERLVVTSVFFGENLPSMSILDAGLFSY
jgi:hypothetical protein